MQRRTARPMTVLANEGAPGPSAQVPLLSPMRSRIGPLTHTNGACGHVDIDLLRKLICGSVKHSTAVMTIGRKAGRQPAMTAFAAIFATVALPNPGSIT